jgi:diguanylate cyclase (GGDEF)-like protein/PAS domain S-box-containing protein
MSTPAPLHSVSLREQITHRLQRILGIYVLGFTGLIFLLALGSVSYFHHNELQQYRALIATKLSAELSAILREADSVGNSSVVWTGLTDSAGREAYLEPLLAKMNRTPHHQIDLLDYRGRDFILSPTSGQRPRLPGATIKRTIETAQPQTQLSSSDQGQLLLFSLPVIAPFTDSPLGILLSSINLTRELTELGLPENLSLEYSLTAPPLNGLDDALKAYSAVPIPFEHQDLVLYVEVGMPIWPRFLVALIAVALTLASGVMLHRQLGRWAEGFAKDLTDRLEALVQVTSKLSTDGVAPPFHDNAGDEITAVFDAVQAIVLRQRAISQKLLVSSRVFETAAEAILITNDQGRIADVNAALLRMTDYPREELVGQPAGLLYRLQETSQEGVNIGEAVRQHGEWRGETYFLTREQRPIPVMLSVSALFDEQQQSLGNVAIFSDISDLKQAEDQLRELSYQDSLTKLPNYRAFSELMHTLLRPDNAQTQRFALLFIDLDHLKLINDSFGHEQGDQVILQIAQNLSRFLPQPHFLCRRSGDEFIAIVHMKDNVAGMQQKLKDSMQTVTHLIELPGGVMTQASFSVGAVVYPDHAQTLNELLVLADSALQSSKEAGRARVTWLNNDIILRLTRRHRIEARLSEALRERLIRPHYQPEVQLSDGQVRGFEALARWDDPELGQVSPAEFIPIAEHMNLIDPLTKVMLSQIVDDLTPLRARFPNAKVAFNVSAKQLGNRRIFQILTHCIDAKCSSFDGLVMEVTETELVQGLEDANLQLELLIGLGIEIAIDDFGKGYSSLARLGQLPIRKLKIDSSFVWSIQDPNTVKIIQAVLALARALHMEVTVEGVETLFQRDMLLDLGCNKAQGFLFARPMSLTDILKLPSHLEPA